ncbi:DnaD domain-containing protein [Staphylococcus delphini]|uniref:DnaD domain-containing protein n=1 Tax=Staphylococcus delphini TaxID=53344 RepID=UPI0023B213B9|nr:DnaD domain-containing protein [Staphylococcus delphini]MDE9753144.1 DnaD domain-containing protein [Staphylococcus delphini]MDE9790362.1 DnaD domain-containing protein [Staphylococcus delphini]MDE9792498.1 DnaD domain-containing protein [Staphylococcus delphini]MDE9795155.1 DnaD domain-containing protein [Staphylococcus delphini]MDE9797262.1 DnaD domain-containing protein [Staphylococcus delphini]
MNQRELQIRPVVIRYELLEHYQELGLNENDLVILIKILYAYEASNEQPSIDMLKKGTTMQSSEVTAIIQKLIQLGLLAMRVEKNNEGKFTEYINLDGFYEQLASIFKQIEQSKETISEEEAFKMVFKKIETAFGRALSPLEIEHLNQWIDVDHYAIELIDAAIDEALAHQKTSLKYIDRILLNWQKNNVTTVKDAQHIRAKFKKQPQQPSQKTEHIPKFNWLKGENPFDK